MQFSLRNPNAAIQLTRVLIRWGIGLLWVLMVALSTIAGGKRIEPPVEGRPENFSWVVGQYQIEAEVSRQKVRVEEPFRLTIRIRGSGPDKFQPLRKKLEIFPPEFKKNFYLQPGEDRKYPKGETQVFEFDYRIQAKDLQANEIPILILFYFNPQSGFYQYARTPKPISLQVQPKEQTTLPPEVAVVAAPGRFYRIYEGDSVLVSHRGGFPHWGWLILAAILPPFGCSLWYAIWRYRNPSWGQRVRRRRSRAARKALRELTRLSQDPPSEKVVAILVQYLKERFEFPCNEPTPSETAAFLSKSGFPSEKTAEAVTFFESCNTVRFAPDRESGNSQLKNQAARVIQEIEGEPW